jgi:hypothetical protein
MGLWRRSRNASYQAFTTIHVEQTFALWKIYVKLKDDSISIQNNSIWALYGIFKCIGKNHEGCSLLPMVNSGSTVELEVVLKCTFTFYFIVPLSFSKTMYFYITSAILYTIHCWYKEYISCHICILVIYMCICAYYIHGGNIFVCLLTMVLSDKFKSTLRQFCCTWTW